MKYLIVITAFLAALCNAELPSSYFPSPPSSNYGPPGHNHHNHGGTVEITKDIYVHVPPPEAPEEFEGGLGRPLVKRKNYKIIFIKAPSANFEQMAKFQAQNQQEEKTIVYVLSKKPELNTILDLQNQNKQKPSKPEVYFIKYKAQKEKQQFDADAPYA